MGGASAQRVELVARALAATVLGDVRVVPATFTATVWGWSPNLTVRSRAELLVALAAMEEPLTGRELRFDVSDLGPDRAVAEFVVKGRHTEPVLLDNDVLVEPRHGVVVLAGAFFAEFDAGRICRYRLYFDDAGFLEQLLL
jgi:hypothetical protein